MQIVAIYEFHVFIHGYSRVASFSGVVIAEGYMNTDEAPVLIREWTIEKVTPQERQREMFRSNIEMGMFFKSF